MAALAYPKKVRLRLIFLLLATAALVADLTVGCSSSGDVGPGGTCFLVTDCQEGLFCLRPDGSDNGTCSKDLAKIQPAADATLADTAPMPGADAAPGDAAGAADSAAGPDSQTLDHAAPPADTGTPPADSGTPDTAPADTGSATSG